MKFSHLEEEKTSNTRTGYDLYYIGEGYKLTFDLEALFLKYDAIKEDGKKIKLSKKEKEIISTLSQFMDLRNLSARAGFACAVGNLLDIITE